MIRAARTKYILFMWSEIECKENTLIIQSINFANSTGVDVGCNSNDDFSSCCETILFEIT